MRQRIIECTTLLIIPQIIVAACITIDDVLTLTLGEKLALDKFRDRVLRLLPHTYMREDAYLINWLRAKDFNVARAELFLKENLIWRKQNKVDTIHEEDFSELLDEYPIHVDTFDKNGSPVLTIVAGDWDVRKAVLFKMEHHLQRLVIKIIDEASVKVRESQLAGKNVTRFHMLWNLKGFSLARHGCPICIMEILSYFQIYENYFPGMADKIIMINAPRQLQIIRPLVRELLSGQSISRFYFFGRNKAEWQRTLLQFIDPNQLTEEFGGTRRRQIKMYWDRWTTTKEEDNSNIYFPF